MNRRTVLRYSAYAAAGAAFSKSFYACKPSASNESFSPSFFDESQYEFITAFGDGLIPESDTPGAVSLGVPQFLDHMVGAVFNPEDHEDYKRDIGLLENHLNEMSQGDYVRLSTLDRTKALSQAEKSWDRDDTSDIKAAYYSLRGQIINYYLNTEYVGTQLLNYLPVPGEYEACIPLGEAGGKAWTI